MQQAGGGEGTTDRVTTVSYKAQPGIHATGAHVPLAGTKHAYTVNKVLWPEEVTAFLETLLVGTSLHACCGKSRLGNIRLDMNESDVDVRGDAAHLPFLDNAVDTILCDPPYNGVFQWNHDMLSELARVAGKRIIFQHWFIPATSTGLYKKAQEQFSLSDVYVWQPRTYFERAQLITVFDTKITVTM